MINGTARLTMLALLSVFLICARNYTASAQSATRPVAEEKVLNIHIWNGYFAPDTLANFKKETGIQVVQSDYVGNQDFEARLARGNTGYDIVVPPSSLY